MQWVVFCSRNAENEQRFLERLAGQRLEQPCGFVGVINPPGMCAGYGEGLARIAAERPVCAAEDRVVFCHDDITFLREDALARAFGHLDEFDAVGVAGTSRVLGPTWGVADHFYLFGQVAHRGPAGKLEISFYHTPRRVVGGMQALDGLFLAYRRNCIEQVGWDAETFSGFHLYDLDTTYRTHLAGFRVGVACDVPLLHDSLGTYDDTWMKWAQLFSRRYRLKYVPQPPYVTLSRLAVEREEDAAEAMTPAYWDDGGRG